MNNKSDFLVSRAFRTLRLLPRYTMHFMQFTNNSVFPFLQILPTVASLLFFRTDSTDSSDCLPTFLSISVFYF